jgi:glycosyltransferase involved in cell wall biosynthesis
MPFFSVIIPVHNRALMIKRALESVLLQDFRDVEIIVVDDGSTDDTAAILDAFSDRVVIIRQENRGVSAARNAGILKARAPWILFLDSDDEYIPGKLAAHRNYIDTHPSILLHQTEEVWIRHGRRVNPMNKHRKIAGDIFIPSLKLCLISPSCACVHHEIFIKHGMFDEALPACEDYDLWLRICLYEKVGLISKAFTMKYGGHSDQLSRKYWGMDRFRVYSICTLLLRHEAEMSDEKKEAAIRIAKEKCNVLMSGALKRRKMEFAVHLEGLIAWLDCHTHSSRDFSFLVQE